MEVATPATVDDQRTIIAPAAPGTTILLAGCFESGATDDSRFVRPPGIQEPHCKAAQNSDSR